MISNKNIINALILYLKGQAPVCFFLLSVDGTVIENNLHAEDVLGCSLVGKNIKDLIVDFFDDFDVQNLPCQGSVEKLVNLSAKDGRPRSYYFCFKKIAGCILAFGRIDFEEIDVMQREILSLNSNLNNLTRELFKKNALLEQANKDLEVANDKILEISRSDPLTQLANRRYFDEKMKEILSLSRRQSQPLSIIMTDIDKFKFVNDTFGHHAGDQVLVGYANLMREHCREEDVVARFGGEEFILALSHTDGRQACSLAERLRQSLAQSDLLDNGHLVTASFGVAQWQGNEEVAELIRRADTALYRAKEAGRNRTLLAD